jgi:hypothetical protein
MLLVKLLLKRRETEDAGSAQSTYSAMLMLPE